MSTAAWSAAIGPTLDGVPGADGRADPVACVGRADARDRRAAGRLAYRPGPFGNLSSEPASTRICWPVMYLASSEARNSTRLEMSTGSTYGIGMAWQYVNAGSTSSLVGFSRSGRN